MTRLELGSVDVPDGWDVDVDAMIRARPRQPIPALAARPGTLKDPPAPTLLLQRRPASHDAAALLRMFLDKTAAATQGMRVMDRDDLVFMDGARAVCVLVALDTTPPVTQIHAVRVDAGVMTHFVLAAAAGDDAGMASLVTTVATWRPP